MASTAGMVSHRLTRAQPAGTPALPRIVQRWRTLVLCAVSVVLTSGAQVRLVMLDVDHFKRVNDVYGHQPGDAILREVARSIRATCRRVEIAARYGGEEFAVTVPELASDEAVRAAERIRTAVEQSLTVVGNQHLRVTVSAGVATTEGCQDPRAASALIVRADTALLLAKRTGRNRVCVNATGA